MGGMTRNSRIALASYAIFGVVLITACESSGTGAAPVPSQATSSRQAPSPVPSSANSPVASPSASSAPPAPGPVPGVIDCVESYSTLYIRPSGITLACGDGTSGVDNMTWATWGTSSATGQGDVFANLCVPSCAAGRASFFPVQVTLSGVKTSSQGAYFSELTVTWEGGRPPDAQELPGHVNGSHTARQDSYSLTQPQAPAP